MSRDTAANEAHGDDAGSRSRYRWVRWAAICVATAVLAVEITLARNQLAQAWRSAVSANPWWVLAAVGAALFSMHSLASVQRILLSSAGVSVGRWRCETTVYAANALSSTLPGGSVVGTTFMFRQQCLWGASPVVASWQSVMSGALRGLSLALLGLGATFLLSAKPKTTRYRWSSVQVHVWR